MLELPRGTFNIPDAQGTLKHINHNFWEWDSDMNRLENLGHSNVQPLLTIETSQINV